MKRHFYVGHIQGTYVVKCLF